MCPVEISVLCALQHSKQWWLAATLSTSIPVIYSFSGGMRASIMTDATQVTPTPCFEAGCALLHGWLIAPCTHVNYINTADCLTSPPEVLMSLHSQKRSYLADKGRQYICQPGQPSCLHAKGILN